VIGVAAGLAVILVLYGLWSLVNPHTVAQRMAFIQMAVAGVGGLTLVAGLLVTLRGQNKNQETTLEQLATAHKQLDLTREGQITDRFTQAIDQLGKTDDNDNKIEEIRLGGIYALEQIAVDEPNKYHWPIMQVLAAYLRRYALWQGDPFQVIEPAADIETVLNVIGRRSRYYEAGEDEPLKLWGTDFSNCLFPVKAHLEGAAFREAHLEHATLNEAQLQKADLRGAHLEGARLSGADLREADLRGAHLEGALLWRADLRGADLRNAYLTATYLSEAKLPEEEKLDPESLEEANGDWTTEVGEIPQPKWWRRQPGDEYPLDQGEFAIKVWKGTLYFRALSEDWYSTLSLPYGFGLSPAGVYFAGLGIGFFSGPWVCDRHKPKESFALELAPNNMVAWFENHPLLTLTTKPQAWKSPAGRLAGMHFYVEVNADFPQNELGKSPEGPSVPIIPASPRFDSFNLVKGKTNQVIVLECEDERLVIIIEGPPNEFDSFKARVDEEVLDNLYWGKNPDEQQF
jgi:hypothetical protein